ncbi:DNA repair protein MmcB-related protein [Aestuariivirga litoralis]|uniref:DNA repair protein MmcB-related protein n=2 Tax=Aestuariivirga litoralis TaxID=2650924 RepID=A0A2W2BMN6_9HYPH|nr:DNA repair protein MmcB-related protein [Aestuariivirga litoralis]
MLSPVENMDRTQPAPRPDGRQSATALMIQRGVCRLLRASGFAVLPEFTLASGRRADVMAISDAGEIWIVEIKSSPEDFRSDSKWPEYRDWCDRLFFAIPTAMEPDMMPADTGLIIADSWGADIIRRMEASNLHASRRKAVTLAFARAAALRLHGLHDPLAETL